MILSFVAEHRARIRRSLVARDRCRQNFALFKQGRHEPVARAAVLDTFADREDVGIGRLHMVVDDDAAIDVEAGLVAELHIRPDSRRDHDQIGFENLAVLERHALCPLITDDRGRRSTEEHADAEIFHLAGEVIAAVRIELAFHQRGHQVHDGHVAAAHLEAARGLQAEQAAADHHRFHTRSGALQQVPRVVERAEREDVLLVESLNRRFEGRASRRQQQRVIRRDAPLVPRDGLCRPR